MESRTRLACALVCVTALAVVITNALVERNRSVVVAQGEAFVVSMPIALVRVGAESLPSAPTAQPGPSGTASATATDSPTPTATYPVPPECCYLLFERWATRQRGPGCRMVYQDIYNQYEFNRDHGHLTIIYGHQPLGRDDLGYFGCGETLTGQGIGRSGILTEVATTPRSFDCGDTRLLGANWLGEILVQHEGQTYPLPPMEEWSDTRVGEDPLEPECVVTTTLRLTNYGWQDRAKIEYR